MVQSLFRQIGNVQKGVAMLYERFMEPFIILRKSKVADGEGGFIEWWEDGETVELAISNDQSIQAQIAEHQGVTSTCTITSYKSVKLKYHDVVRRKRDGSTYRVTSRGDSKVSPNFSPIDMNRVTAERWDIPNE